MGAPQHRRRPARTWGTGPGGDWQLVRARLGPRASGVGEARRRVGAASWLRRWVGDVVVDRLGGRVGLRLVRLQRQGRVVVLAETVDCLTAAVLGTHPRADTIAARRFTVVVAWWSGPWRGWPGRLGPLSGVVRQRLSFPAGGRGRVRVDVRLDRPVLVREALAAVLHAVRPAPAAAVPLATVRDPMAVVVDERRVNPRGRRPEAYDLDAPRLRLVLSDESEVDTFGRNRAPWGWPGQPAWRTGSTGELGWSTVTALRRIGTVECGRLAGRDPLTEASLLAQLAMTGVVLYAPYVDSSVAGLLAPELREVIAEPLVESGSLARESRSVRQRRAALRGHSVQFGEKSPPGVSAILATRRSEYLPRILRSMVEQTYPYLEIVLCLHGIALPAECADYLDHCGRGVEVLRVPAELSFGTALGLATRAAGGSLVTKFDDDDTYSPEHVWDLVLARAFSGATLVGKGIEFVYLENADVTVRRRSGQPESDTDVVAGGTMLIARDDLEQLGGWRPLPRSVDRGLLDRVNRAGATIYRTHPLGYLYHRHGHGHTWSADDDFFLRQARQRWRGRPDFDAPAAGAGLVAASGAGQTGAAPTSAAVDQAEYAADEG